MHIINILRDIWTRYGGGFNNLSRSEQVAKPLTAVDSIKMYGSGNAQKLVKETTSIVDQVASGLKDSTGIDLPSLLNGLISSSDTDSDPAESPVD